MRIDLYRTVAKETFGTLKFKIGDFDVENALKIDEFDISEAETQFA